MCRKRKNDVTGTNALKHIRDLPQGDSSGLGKFCLGRAKDDVAKAAKIVTDDMEAHCSNRHSLQCDVPLNRFMVNHDIEEFLANCLGIVSWEDLSEDDKRKCFKDCPKKSLPDWDEIVQEGCQMTGNDGLLGHWVFVAMFETLD